MRTDKAPILINKYATRMTILAILFIFGYATILISCLVKKKSPEYYYEYGKHYVAEGDLVQAQRNFTRAIKENPNYYDAYYQRAQVWQQTDSIENAINDYDTLLTFKNLTVDKTAELYFLRGNMNYLISQDTIACRDWKSACDLNHNKACDLIRKRCKK